MRNYKKQLYDLAPFLVLILRLIIRKKKLIGLIMEIQNIFCSSQ